MIVQEILKELTVLSEMIDQEQINDVCKVLQEKYRQKKSVYIGGVGRSGCCAKAFANRLMHLGFTVYIVGDVITPPIKEEDVLFIISGSGKTTSLIPIVKKAKEYQATVITITLQKEGDISKMANHMIVLAGTTRLQSQGMYQSIQPIGSSFEQLSWLMCDGLVLMLKDELKLTNEILIKNHGNLE